jgi:hypothetical protein
MSINLVCRACKSNLSVRSRVCKNCGYDFRSGKKYKVVVKDKDGRRISKVLDSISMAKKLERKLKTQSLENSLFGISKIWMIDDVLEKYLSWAKQHKKSWNKDMQRWQMHVQPYLRGKKMDAITTYDVHFAIKKMRSKRDYAPATIKHVIVLVN